MILKYLPITGILCLVYYIIIVIFSGFKTAFSFIWVVLGSLLIFLPKLNQMRIHLFGTTVVSKVLKWSFLSCTVIALCIIVIASAMIISGMTQKGQPGYAYIIVLGAQVKGETAGVSLLKRLEQAYSYLEENPDTKAVLSGGQGPGEDITEAECMRRYLLNKGLAASRIIVEDKSTSTYENIIFSRDKINDLNAKVGIVSNDFHIFRAVRLARNQGFINAEGIAAPAEPFLELHFFVREIAAVLKDKLVGNI